MRALARRPTAIVSSTLTKTVLVANYFFRIRCEAALALVHVSRIRIPVIEIDAPAVCDSEARVFGPFSPFQTLLALLLRTRVPGPGPVQPHIRPQSERLHGRGRVFRSQDFTQSDLPGSLRRWQDSRDRPPFLDRPVTIQ